MTQYTREELNGVRKYKRELKARRQMQFKKMIGFTVKCIVVAGSIYLLGSLLSTLGIDGRDEVSSIEKYPTAQSYIDQLNSLPSTERHLTVEDVYGLDR